MVDQLIYSLKEVSQQLLPILGAVVLIMLIVVLKKLISFINECTLRMKQLESTVKGVDTSIEKLQEPLNSVVKIAHGVDKAYVSTENALKGAAAYVVSSYESYQAKQENKETVLNEEYTKKGDTNE